MITRKNVPTQPLSFTNTLYAVFVLLDPFHAEHDEFIMQPVWATGDAKREGWAVIATGLEYEHALELRARLKNRELDVLEYSRMVVS